MAGMSPSAGRRDLTKTGRGPRPAPWRFASREHKRRIDDCHSLGYNPLPPMDWVFLKIFAVLILVLANGFFVAVEFALVSVRRARIETLAAAGKSGANAVLRALDHLDAM